MPATTTSDTGKIKFATQLSPDVLMQLKETAKKEGRQIQAILDEALREYFQSRQQQRPRPHVMKALRASIRQHHALYQELAK